MLTQHIMQQVAITFSTFDNRANWSDVETFITKNNIWNDQGLHHTIPQTFTQRHLKWGEDNNNDGLTLYKPSQALIKRKLEEQKENFRRRQGTFYLLVFSL